MRSPTLRQNKLLRLEALESRLLLVTFVVSTTGNDAAAGSATSPWKTLQHAAKAVTAGDTVLVRAGSYTGFDLWASGTEDKPITFKADAGVKITTPNTRTKQDGINLENASHIVIDGFQINQMPRSGIRAVGGGAATIWPTMSPFATTSWTAMAAGASLLVGSMTC